MRFLLKKTTSKLSDIYQLHLKETKMVSGGSGPNKDKDPKRKDNQSRSSRHFSLLSKKQNRQVYAGSGGNKATDPKKESESYSTLLVYVKEKE